MNYVMLVIEWRGRFERQR